MGKIEVQSFKQSTYFMTFSDNFFQNIGKFSKKIFAIFGLKSLKLWRFFGIWKWTEDEDEDGSSDKNLRSFVATLFHSSFFIFVFHLVETKPSKLDDRIFDQLHDLFAERDGYWLYWYWLKLNPFLFTNIRKMKTVWC